MKRVQSLVSRAVLGRAGRVVIAAAVLGAGVPVLAQTAPVVTNPAPTTAMIGEGSWKVQVMPDAAAAAAGRPEFTEYSLVEGTRVVFHEMSRLGFKTTTISATPAATSTAYTITIKSRDGGTVVITGTATTTTNNGSAVWTMPDGKVYNYTFSGVPCTPGEAES